MLTVFNSFQYLHTQRKKKASGRGKIWEIPFFANGSAESSYAPMNSNFKTATYYAKVSKWSKLLKFCPSSWFVVCSVPVPLS